MPAPSASTSSPPPRDEQTTSVLDGDELSAAQAPSASRSAAPRPRPVVSDDDLARGDDAYAKARRPRWVAPLAAVLLLGAVGVFVATDPLGVMPGIVESFDRAASEMYPSRQVAEKGSASDSAPETGETGAGEADSAHVLSEPEAFQLLSAVYAEITSYQDALGPVIETFNGQYLIKDFDQRSQASQGAYDLRSTIQQTLDELDSLRLTENTAYAEDVEHLKQLATWMYNRRRRAVQIVGRLARGSAGRASGRPSGRDPRASARGVHGRWPRRRRHRVREERRRVETRRKVRFVPRPPRAGGSRWAW